MAFGEWPAKWPSNRQLAGQVSARWPFETSSKCAITTIMNSATTITRAGKLSALGQPVMIFRMRHTGLRRPAERRASCGPLMTSSMAAIYTQGSRQPLVQGRRALVHGQRSTGCSWNNIAGRLCTGNSTSRDNNQARPKNPMESRDPNCANSPRRRLMTLH